MEKRIQLTLTGELDELGLVLDGEDLEELLEQFEPHFEFESSARYRVVDEWPTPKGGLPPALLRQFDSLRGTALTTFGFGPSSDEHRFDLASRLEDTEVRFVRNSETGASEPEFVTTNDSLRRRLAHLLDGLDEDMSLRGLLPPASPGEPNQELPVGTEWELEPATLLGAAFPGGNLGLRPADEGTLDEDELEQLFATITRALQARVPDWTSGGATGSYLGCSGSEEEEEHRIGIELELDADADLSELLQAWSDRAIESFSAEGGLEIEAARLETQIRGSGELAWSAKERRLATFEVGGEYEARFTLIAEAGPGAPYGHERLELSFAFHGTWGTEVVAE